MFSADRSPDQGSNPWSLAQRPLLKQLKLKSALPRAQKPLSEGGAPVSSSDSSPDASSDEASEDDSGTDEEMEPEPPLITQPRPNDPIKAIGYDVVKTVWAQPKLRVASPAIKAALGKYWELIKSARDEWKIETSACSVAEAKKNKEDMERHRVLANEKRKALDHAFRMTTEHGHPDIVEKYVLHFLSLLLFYSLAASRKPSTLSVCACHRTTVNPTAWSSKSPNKASIVKQPP